MNNFENLSEEEKQAFLEFEENQKKLEKKASPEKVNEKNTQEALAGVGKNMIDKKYSIPKVEQTLDNAIVKPLSIPRRILDGAMSIIIGYTKFFTEPIEWNNDGNK